MQDQQLSWKGESVPGTEKLKFEQKNHQLVADSHVTGGDADSDTRWKITYTIVCDETWHVRQVAIVEKLAGHWLILHGDGNGNWSDDSGAPLPVIAGCVDVDFRATPFSNTLPIRRLGLGVGESTAIEVAYIDAPDLTLTKERQVYTRLSANTWRFEQPDANFEAMLTVDDEGFILDYPGLFSRVKS